VGGGAVAPFSLVGTAGEAGADVGQEGQGGAGRFGGGDHGADPGPHRTHHVDGQHRGVEPEGGVDHVGVGLVEVGR